MLLLTHTENKVMVISGGEAEERGIQPVFFNKCKWNLTFKKHIEIKKKNELLLPQVLRGCMFETWRPVYIQRRSWLLSEVDI